MIHWSRLDKEHPPRWRRLWRRCRCKRLREGGACMGVSRTVDDDEPDDICKACDEFAGARESEES